MLGRNIIAARATTGFFIPQVKKSEQEDAYAAMIAAVKYQFNWTVTERRIQSLTYQGDRRVITAKVGEREQFEHHFEIVAILEASVFLVVTRLPNGQPGPTVLVNPSEVTAVVEF